MALFNGTDAGWRAPVPHGQRSAAGRPNQAMVYLVLLSATLFSIMYARAILGAASQAGLKPIGTELLTFKVLVEVVASYFGIGFVFAAIAYLWHEPAAAGRNTLRQFPPVGLVYLLRRPGPGRLRKPGEATLPRQAVSDRSRRVDIRGDARGSGCGRGARSRPARLGSRAAQAVQPGGRQARRRQLRVATHGLAVRILPAVRQRLHRARSHGDRGWASVFRRSRRRDRPVSQ